MGPSTENEMLNLDEAFIRNHHVGYGGYWTISIKSTGVVMCDPFYLFDISAAVKFLRDTSKMSTFQPKF
jgi:hypothetical protein